MLWCGIQYVVYFTNLAVVGAFCFHSLCRRVHLNQYSLKIKVLIMMLFISTLFTVSVVLYHFLENNSSFQCIYFGSLVAIFAIDLEN